MVFVQPGTSVFQVTATDADDPTYGNSAKIVYSILQGQPFFTVDPKTGRQRFMLSMYITCFKDFFKSQEKIHS